MVEFARNSPSEFKEYYIQMQAAKRSQAPSLSQVSIAHCKVCAFVCFQNYDDSTHCQFFHVSLCFI